MKSEPSGALIDDLAAAPGRPLPWTGVRNRQARNFMRDSLWPGDGVLFYHSSCAKPGIAGLAEIAGNLATDATEFDPARPYFDPNPSTVAPRWLQIDVRLRHKTRFLSLAEMRDATALAALRVLQTGQPTVDHASRQERMARRAGAARAAPFSPARTGYSRA